MLLRIPMGMSIGRGRDGDANQDAYRKRQGCPIGMPIGRDKDYYRDACRDAYTKMGSLYEC